MGSESIEAATARNSSSSSGKFFPPGFRFHPTDEELILYYLKRKICGRSLKLDVIGEVDVYKWDPEELPGQFKWKTGDRQWFFFSPRDRKYLNGGRSNRGTMHGYWKATGRDRIIKCNSRSVGVKKTLVYYQGRAPSGERTDWVMHEYTLDEEELKRCRYIREYYALYKVFKKSGPGPKNGEQYGAPFVEEEWPDGDEDDYLEVDALLVQKINPVADVMVEPEIVQVNPVNGEDESQDSLLVSKVDFLDQSHEPQSLVVNEDFLEVDDLIGLQPASQNSQLLVPEYLPVADLDGFYEFDFYNELSPFGSQQIQQSYYMDNLEYEMQNSGFRNWSEDVDAEPQTGDDPWAHDQSQCDSMATHAQAPSGVLNPNDSGVNQCGEDDSWFSSALWAFVESVPTSPASALESSARVNKRLSSLSRIRKANEAAAAAAAYSSRGIVYFSILGVLLAILCVFVGTSIELLGGYIL